MHVDESQLREIVDQQTEMVCRFSADGKLIFANRAYMQTMGTTPEDLPHFDFKPLVHPDDWADVEATLATISATNPRVVIENRLVFPNGRTLWTQWTNIGIFDGHGNLVAFQSAGRDITDAKLNEARLREAHDQKDRFLAVLAHELRNPLSATLNALSVLEAQAAAAGPVPRALEIAKRQARQQARLLDDLLDVSRINQGKVQLRKTEVNFFALVSDLVEAHRPVFAMKSQSLTLLVPTEAAYVHADHVRIEQVVSNLLDNASKYTPEGGAIVVTGETSDGYVTLAVADNGQGIAAEALPKVFDLFQQAPQPGGVASGLGIGLTVVRELLRQHGGSVVATSPGIGAGSTFTLRLPAVAGPTTPHLASDTTAHCDPQRRVLVVDDNVDAADMLADLLRHWGHNVKVVYDGYAALQVAQSFKPQLALIDIAMPGIDGFATATRLRAEHSKGSLTLIALTGFGQTADIAKSLAAQFDRHLTKPADHAALRQIIQRLPDV